MTNSIDATRPTYWSKRYQALLRTRNLARQQVSFQEQSNLSDGQTVNRPTSPDVSIQSLTRGSGSYTRQDLASVQESLTVNNWDAAVVSFTTDELKQIKNSPTFVNDAIDRGAYQLNRKIDRAYLGQYSNASYATTPATYTKTDIYDGCAEVHRVLRDAGVEQDRPWFLNVDAEMTKLIQTSNASRETKLGDEKTKSGFGFSTKYAGFSIFEANGSLTWTGNINVATNVSEGDTIVIDGVTFVFNATPSGAGSVDIGASAAASLDNLVLLINDPSTTTATGIALSTANALKFQANGHTLISAVDNATSVALTSTKGRITLAETFTDTTDNVSDMILHCLGGRMGAVDMVFQRDLVTEDKDVSGAKKRDYVTDILWGIKTFAEGANRLIDFKITTQADSPVV